MHCDSTALIFRGCQELRYNFVRRSRSIKEIQIEMSDALFSELLLFILRLVEADDKRDSQPSEDRHIIIRCEGAIAVSCVQRAREGDELSWDDPIQVSILDFLKVLIFLDIERAIVIPSECYSKLETLEAVQVCATISTIAHCGVTVWDEFIVVRAESLPGIVGGLVEDNNHEGAHEESSVALLCVVKRSVVIDFVVLVLLVVH